MDNQGWVPISLIASFPRVSYFAVKAFFLFISYNNQAHDFSLFCGCLKLTIHSIKCIVVNIESGLTEIILLSFFFLIFERQI